MMYVGEDQDEGGKRRRSKWKGDRLAGQGCTERTRRTRLRSERRAGSCLDHRYTLIPSLEKSDASPIHPQST